MANEVGKVSVRVFPDTRGFALRTKQQLGKLKDISFKVNVELNEKQLRAKVDKLVAKTNVDLLKPSNRIKFHATLDANERDLRSEVRDMRERLQDQADSSKVKFEAELGRAAGRKGDGAGLLGLDAKQIVRDLTRELGQTTVPVNTKINGDRVVKDLERSMSSKRFDIEVEMKVDRKEALKEVESVTELISHTIKTHRKMKGMKFAIEVDKASIKRWKSELENLDSFLKGNTREIERQTKEYKKWGAEITRLKKEAAGADKELERLSKREAADLRREVEATEELAELRKEMAKSAEAHAAGVLRERRLVEKVAAIRREAAKRSTERAESEVELQKRALKIQEQIKSLEEKRTQYSNRRIEWDSEAIDQEQIRKDLQSKLDRATERLKVDSIELDVSLDQVSVEAVAARLTALARTRVATIWVNMRQTGVREFEQLLGRLDRGAKVAGFNAGKWLTQLTGLRVLWQTFRDMVDWLPRLDMMVPQIAQNTALLTAAVTGLVGAVGMGFTLINDVAQIAKLALAGPAMITGLVGSVLIVGRAIADFKDVFPEIIDYYEQLGKIVSGRVWKQAAGPIRELHKATVPLLNSHVPDWATAWGDAMGALAKGAKSKSSLLAFENFLENSIKGTRNATKGWEALGGALMNLLGAGSEVFPELGTWFSETMEDFRRWTAENAGNIDDWIRQGMTALRQLGSVAVSTGKIFKGVGDAFSAAGWPGLAEFESAMRSIGDAALVLKNSDGFMQPLKQIRRAFDQFSGLEIKIEEAFKNLWGMVGDTVENLARPMANALAYILDGFNSDKFGSGFGTFITGIADFIKEIGPGLGAMTEEIGSLLGVVGTAAESWGPAFNEMLELFASAGDKLHPGLIDFVESMGPKLLDLVEDITPHVEDFAEALGNLLGDEDFQELVGDLIDDLGTLGGIILDVGTWVLQTAGKFSDWYGTLSEGEQKFVRWGGILTGVFSGITAAIGGLALKLAPGATLRLIGRGLAFLGEGIWVALKGLGGLLGRGLSKIFPKGGLLRLLLPRVLGALGGPVGWALLLADLLNLIKPIKIMDWVTGLLEAWGLDDSFVGRLWKGLRDNIAEAFGSDVGLIQFMLPIYNIIHKGLEGFFSGMFDGWKEGGLWGAIKGAFVGLADGLWRGFADHWQYLWLTITDIWNWLFGGGEAKEEMLSASDGAADMMSANFDGGMSNLWAKFQPKIAEGIAKLHHWLNQWQPTTKGGRFVKDLLKKLPGMLGFNDNGSWSFDTLKSSWDGAIDRIWEFLEPEIAAGIARLYDFLARWEPTSEGGQWVHDLLERLPGLLGFNDDGSWSFDTLVDSWVAFGEKLWTEDIKPWLEEQWDILVENFKNWEPVAAVIDFIEDPVGTVVKWLGLDEEWAPVARGGGAIQHNWGDTMWTNHLEPYLNEGWDTLQGHVGSWDPSGGGDGGGGKGKLNLGGMIGRLLGVGPEAETYVGTGLGRIYRQVTGFNGSVAESFFSTSGTLTGSAIEMQTGVETAYSGMTRGATSEVERLANESRKRHDDAMREAILKSQEMSVGVGSKYGEMRSSASSKLSGLDSDASQKFGSMSSTGKKKTGDMKTGVVSNFSTMQSQAAAKAAVMQVNVVRAMTQANVMGVRQANVMSSAYVAAMVRLVSGSVRIASQLRGTLPRLLTINATGPGRSTGNSFVSGLASGLSRAVGIARSMAGGIRRALSINVFSSGSAVGGSFASGLRSRAGAVASAATALAAAARSRMPNSPADEGPFSGSGWGGWGESIAEELARGLRKSAPEVAREAQRLMGGVHTALEARSNAHVGVDFERTRRRHGLFGDADGYQANGTTVNVNVESRSEDPLRDGNRFGGDIAFALRGAGLA